MKLSTDEGITVNKAEDVTAIKTDKVGDKHLQEENVASSLGITSGTEYSGWEASSPIQMLEIDKRNESRQEEDLPYVRRKSISFKNIDKSGSRLSIALDMAKGAAILKRDRSADSRRMLREGLSHLMGAPIDTGGHKQEARNDAVESKVENEQTNDELEMETAQTEHENEVLLEASIQMEVETIVHSAPESVIENMELEEEKKVEDQLPVTTIPDVQDNTEPTSTPVRKGEPTCSGNTR